MISGKGAALRETHKDVYIRSYADVPAFSRSVLSLLERTEYRRCVSGDDIEDIFRLRYKAYRANGMVAHDSSAMIHDSLDDEPNCYNFGVYVDQHLVSTLRLHHLTGDRRNSPSTKAFGDIVHPMIDAGRTYIDPSRFAADPDWTRDFPQLPYITLRLAIMGSMHFDVDDCLITIREDHASFYRRIFSAEVLSDKRSYPGVYNKVQLFHSSLAVNLQNILERFSFFRSTAMERRLMFTATGTDGLRPLTILPTAKYLFQAAA